VTDAPPPEEPSGDPRDALIAAQAERIAALEALVADLRERLAAAERAGSRNSGNSSMPPSADDQPGRRIPRQQRRAAERAEKKRNRGKQPGSPGAAMRWEVPDRIEEHYPLSKCACGRDLAGAADLGVARSYQQEEIPAAPAERVQHDLHEVRCACGRPQVAARPAGDAGFRPVHRAAAARPGRLPGGLPACPGGAVPAADRRRDRRGRLGRVVHSCLRQAASLAAEVVRLIRALITAAAVAGFDGTTLRSGPAAGRGRMHYRGSLKYQRWPSGSSTV
jgi:transposase